MGAIADFLLGQPRVAEHSLASVSYDDQVRAYMTAGANRERAASVAAIYRARLMTADVMAGIPVLVDGEPWRSESAAATAGDFIAETVLSLLDTGDAYWRVSAQGTLTVLNPGDMTVAWNNETRSTRVYMYRNQRVFPGVNLRVLSMDRGPEDLTGYGPMQSARIQGLIAENQYAQDYYRNNGDPTGILKLPSSATADEADALKKAWVNAQQVRTPAVLSGGIEWERTGFSANDSQWVEAHRAGVGDAALLFGIPGAILGYNTPGSSLTYQSLGDLHEQWWRQTLYPSFAKRIADNLAAVYQQPVEFDPEQFFLASLTSRSTAVQQLTTTGYDPAAVLDAVGFHPMPFVGFDGGGQETPNATE